MSPAFNICYNGTYLDRMNSLNIGNNPFFTTGIFFYYNYTEDRNARDQSRIPFNDFYYFVKINILTN